jgi:hypothetical protein
VRLVLAAAALLVSAPAASAHGVIRIAGGELVYLSDDSSSASQLEITADLVQIRVSDPGSVGGIQAPSSCSEQRVDDRGYTIEWTCPAAGVVRIGAETGPSEDSAVVRGGLPVRLHGDSGADALRTADAGDVLRGRDGNDTLDSAGGDDQLEPGPGADAVSAGAGADIVSAADGERDAIACGEGADRAVVDQLDAVEPDCETVERSSVAPPAVAAEGDTAAPRLTVRAASRQRAGRARLRATSGEAGRIDVSAYLERRGIRTRLTPVHRTVRAGHPVTIRLGRKKGQSPHSTLVVTVVATDRAGNASRPKTVRIRLTG